MESTNVKPKIFFILHLAPPVHGAAVAGGYIKDSSLINQSVTSTYINLATASSLEDIGKTGFNKILVIVKLWYSIFLKLKREQFQLCYLTINARGPAWLKELGIVALVKIFRVPIVYHYHNKGVAENSTNFFKKKLYTFQFKNTKTILLSPLLYKDIAPFVEENKVYYCPNGIPTATTIQKELLVTNTTKTATILFLSNLIESKGVYILLEACLILKKKNIPFNCIYIGGEGNITANQLEEKIIQYNLQNVVEYQGKKYGIEKERAFAEADLFAFPTYYDNETFGLVNLEAMQFALPIISTFEGAIPEVVQDGITGYLVPQQNAVALADQLEILINNPDLRKEMGLAGKKQYEEKFTLEIFEKRMLEIILDASATTTKQN
jgi:glycosyltransferase involved in cell wall biosynthesis